MGSNHTECTVVHVRGPEGEVNPKAKITDDSNIPGPVEERRTHYSSWEDDLYEPVRSLYYRLITELTSLAGGLK